MIQCKYCSKNVQESSLFCEHCGNVVEAEYAEELLRREEPSAVEAPQEMQPLLTPAVQQAQTQAVQQALVQPALGFQAQGSAVYPNQQPSPGAHTWGGQDSSAMAATGSQASVPPTGYAQGLPVYYPSPTGVQSKMDSHNKQLPMILIAGGGVFLLLVLVIALKLTSQNRATTAQSVSVDTAMNYSAEVNSVADEMASDDDWVYEQANALSDEEVLGLVQDFYLSYLNCINAGDTSYLEFATEGVRAEVASRLSAPGNIQYYFEFSSCEMVANSRQNVEISDVPTIELDVTFYYQYWNREGSQERTNGSNTQSIQLQYRDSGWTVSGFVHHGR